MRSSLALEVALLTRSGHVVSTFARVPRPRWGLLLDLAAADTTYPLLNDISARVDQEPKSDLPECSAEVKAEPPTGAGDT